jgi:hypothetical protein
MFYRDLGTECQVCSGERIRAIGWPPNEFLNALAVCPDQGSAEYMELVHPFNER